MSNQPPDSSLLNDDRAVVPLIAFILLFGILVVALAGYQAEVVPDQNQGVEFEHLQEVENDLIQVRSSILRAGQTDVRELATIRLGTRYPTRLIAINPPDPAGTLRTSAHRNITITNETAALDTGTTVNVSTRFLEYRPGYSELPSNTVRYENSVLYREAGDNIVVIEDQYLVRDGDTLAITALQNDLNERSTGRVTLEFYPTENVTADEIPDGNLTVTIPTRLNGSNYWDDELGEFEIYENVSTNDTQYEDEDINELELNINTAKGGKEFTLNTVGIQSEPEDDQTEPLKQGVGLSPGDETVNNDNGDGSALVLEDGSTPGIKSSALEFNISNTGQSPVTITEFSLSTPGKSNSNANAVNSIDRDATGNTVENAEVQIRDRDGDELLGYATPDSGQSDKFDTDGSLYVMDRTGGVNGRGEEATINSDTVVSVDMGEFNDGNTLQYSSIDSKADSDLTATFTLEGDTTVEFYFEVTAANT